MHTQGGTHKRRHVATAGVTFVEGPHASRLTQKAVCGNGRSHVLEEATVKPVHT